MSPPPDIADALRLLAGVETATIGHFRNEGFVAPAIQGLGASPRICGPALTVLLRGDDGTAMVRALSAAKPGEVLVVDRGEDESHACWGAVLTAAAQARGLAGAVVDGFVTDVAAIETSGFPVWCRGRSPLTTKARGGGLVGVTIRCGGAVVHQGDVILADENGVAVLPPAEARAIAERALEIQAKEPDIIARIRAGEDIAAVYGIAPEG